MTKTELTAKTVAELKALAKKKNVSIPAGGKKPDIIKALAAAGKQVKPAAKKAAVKSAPKKAAAPAKKAVKKAAKKTAKKAVAAPKTAKKTAARAVKPKKAAAKKSAAKKLAAGKHVIKKAVAKKSVPVQKKSSSVSTRVREWKQSPNTEEPLMAQERVAGSKFYTGPALKTLTDTAGELPKGYGEEKIVLLSRDPHVAYAYWEVSPDRIEREKAWFGWDSTLSVRIYDITGVQFDGRNAVGYYDQEVLDRTGGWYFDFGRPAHAFCADLGLLSVTGRFLTIARSNYVVMPREGVSDVIDEQWMLVDEDFWKIYGFPEVAGSGMSSEETQEQLRRRQEMEITSPGMFSRERGKKK